MTGLFGVPPKAELAPEPKLRSEYRLLLWLLLITAVVHLPSLFNPFFIDDYVYLEAVHALDWTRVVDIFTTSTMNEQSSAVWWTPSGDLPLYRPIGEMTFAADFLVWGLVPFGFHLTNLVLHLVCTCLTWSLARRLLDKPGLAMAAATVFALHPVHNEAVVWISGRFDLLVCLCVLSSTLCYLKWRKGEGRRWSIFTVLLFVVGLGCKETALVLPAMLAAVELLAPRGPDEKRRIAGLAVGGAALTLVSMLYIAGRFALFGGLGTIPPPYGLDTSSPIAAVGDLGWNLAQYLLDFVLFVQVDAFIIATFWSNHLVLMGVALAVSLLLCVIGVTLAWRLPAFRLGLVWTALFTAPSLMAMPGERNVYLSSVGVALVAAGVIGALWRRGEVRPALKRWTRRGATALLALWVTMGVVEQAGMWFLSTAGENVLRDVQTALPDPPPDARIIVVNQCPLNFVGFGQALRLRYGREDLSGWALTLSPTLQAVSTDEIVVTGPDSIRVVRKGGVFFESFIERFLLFSIPAPQLSEVCRRFGLTLINPPPSYDRITELEFQLPFRLDDPRLQIFHWDNQPIDGISDLVDLLQTNKLKRFFAPQ